MHYIRFLKTPRITVDHGAVLLKAVLTVTTDIGETFYPENIDLVVTICSFEDDTDILLRKKVPWQAGARSVPVSFDLSRQDLEWPACVHVSARSARAAGFLPPICDIWSGSMNPVKGHFESGYRVERRFVSLAERPVTFIEDAGDSIARHLWDGSQALAQHIDDTISLENPITLPLLEYVLASATYRRLNVIELGCGVGTVGISIAQAIPDCDVLLTDLPDVANLVNSNISVMRPAMASRARFESLDWAEPLPINVQSRTNHLIILSECTYNTDMIAPLVATLLGLVVRSPKAVIALATKTRHHSESEFFNIMKETGLIEEGSLRLPLPGLPGQGYADWATDVGLYLFRGQEHRMSVSPRNGSEEEVPQVKNAELSGSTKRSQSR